MLIEHGTVTCVIAFLHIYLGEQGADVTAIVALSMAVSVLVKVAVSSVYRVKLGTTAILDAIVDYREEHQFSASIVMEHQADLTPFIDLTRDGLYTAAAS